LLTPLDRANRVHETYRESVISPHRKKEDLVQLIRKEIEEAEREAKLKERKRLKEKYQHGIMKYKEE
jgi:hypothetical protein